MGEKVYVVFKGHKLMLSGTQIFNGNILKA